MTLAYYMDHNVPISITHGLRLRGIDVLTAYEDDSHELDDPTLLDRAFQLRRVIFTRDDDFLIEAARRQVTGTSFYGVIYAHQLRVAIGTCVEQLELIALASEPEDMLGTVTYLPL